MAISLRGVTQTNIFQVSQFCHVDLAKNQQMSYLEDLCWNVLIFCRSYERGAKTNMKQFKDTFFHVL